MVGAAKLVMRPVAGTIGRAQVTISFVGASDFVKILMVGDVGACKFGK